MPPNSYLTASDLGMDKRSIKQSVANHIEYTQGKDEYSATPLDFFWALARSARDRMFDRWNKTQQGYYVRDVRRVYYLSLEFLPGRLLEDGLYSLGIHDEAESALSELGLKLSDLAEMEVDPGLGNGGLGRLAACFLDSMATLAVPAMGYGIRYEYGIFRQAIVEGQQVERADNWLRYGNPWDMPRPERLYVVPFGGRVELKHGRVEWVDTETVIAMAHDIPVPGYRNGVVNTLRLWAAKASREFDFQDFNRGDYIAAIEAKNATENISRVLYPNDMVIQGRELRLKQEFFFVSATLQDAIYRHLKTHPSLANLPDKAVFQLNDTHPAIAVAELMRILVDLHAFEWDAAWKITSGCFAYTNHTVLPEALEVWPLSLLERLLPRHVQIIFELNTRFLKDVRARYPGDEVRVQRMSLVHEEGEKRVRMANLAILGSRSVNGVSELHSKILRERLFHDFADMLPDRFNSKTNGITPRRWLLKCNPGLSTLISRHIGRSWPTQLTELEALKPLTENEAFQAEWRAVKRENKERLAKYLKTYFDFQVDPDSLFDVQIKRIHEYKRQLLNLLNIASLYLDYCDGMVVDDAPRTFLVAGKAAPGYDLAKRTVRLFNDVAEVVNSHPGVNERMRVYFVPNYSVSLAEVIIPATDVSIQISLAGMEASGTGNMKFALNGALTVGTLDGANVEIAEAVGRENIFIFGLDVEGVARLRQNGYVPRTYYERDPRLRRTIDAIATGRFSPGDPGRHKVVADYLMNVDPYMVLADFSAFGEIQAKVSEAYRSATEWTTKSILNTASMGPFSSDAVIEKYAREIWGAEIGPGKQGGF